MLRAATMALALAISAGCSDGQVPTRRNVAQLSVRLVRTVHVANVELVGLSYVPATGKLLVGGLGAAALLQMGRRPKIIWRAGGIISQSVATCNGSAAAAAAPMVKGVKGMCICLLDPKSGRRLKILPQRGSSTFLLCSPTASKFVVVTGYSAGNRTRDSMLRVYATASGRMLDAYKIRRGVCRSLSLSRSGRDCLLSVAAVPYQAHSHRDFIQVVGWRDGHFSRPIPWRGDISDAAFLGSSKRIAVAGSWRRKGRLTVLNAATGRTLHTAAHADPRRLYTIFVNRPERLIGTLGLGGRLKIWNFRLDLLAKSSALGPKRRVWDAAFSRGGRYIYGVCSDGAVRVWRLPQALSRKKKAVR